MKFDKPATTNPIDQGKVVGKPTDRIDGPLKTTGTAPYAYERHDVAPNQAYTEELEVLYRRSHLINTAIAASTACGLLVCLVIAMLFLGDTANLPLDQYIAGSFVLAMLALILSFAFLLREIFIASAFMRAQHDASRPPPR
jgi:hypothetical protein